MNKIKKICLLSGLSIFIRQGREGFHFKGAQEAESGLSLKLYELIDFLLNLKAYVSIKGLMLTLMLSMVIVMSAIGVVQSSHLSRQLFAEQAIFQDRNDQLQLEWAQLLLEQSAWSSPNRLEGVASQKLGMHTPEAEEIQLLY